MYKIFYSEEVLLDLTNIRDFISKNDYLERAIKFIGHIVHSIDGLREMPYKFRKSIYYNDDEYRDMIIKGFTITYRIEVNSRVIYILSIFRSKT